MEREGERERELEPSIIYIVHNQTKIQNDLLSKVDERELSKFKRRTVLLNT